VLNFDVAQTKDLSNTFHITVAGNAFTLVDFYKANPNTTIVYLTNGALLDCTAKTGHTEDRCSVLDQIHRAYYIDQAAQSAHNLVTIPTTVLEAYSFPQNLSGAQENILPVMLNGTRVALDKVVGRFDRQHWGLVEKIQILYRRQGGKGLLIRPMTLMSYEHVVAMMVLLNIDIDLFATLDQVLQSSGANTVSSTDVPWCPCVTTTNEDEEKQREGLKKENWLKEKNLLMWKKICETELNNKNGDFDAYQFSGLALDALNHEYHKANSSGAGAGTDTDPSQIITLYLCQIISITQLGLSILYSLACQRPEGCARMLQFVIKHAAQLCSLDHMAIKTVGFTTDIEQRVRQHTEDHHDGSSAQGGGWYASGFGIMADMWRRFIHAGSRSSCAIFLCCWSFFFDLPDIFFSFSLFFSSFHKPDHFKMPSSKEIVPIVQVSLAAARERIHPELLFSTLVQFGQMLETVVHLGSWVC